MSPSPILILDNQEPVRLLLTKSLEGAGHSVTALPFPEDLGNLLQEHSPSLLVLEDTELKRPLSDLNDFLRLNHERLPYILISSAPEISRAIEAIRGGACDYLPKPIDMPQLLKKVSSALESRKKESALLDRRRQFKTGKGLTFYKLKSPAMERVYDQASQVAMSPDTTVLISGESGTGKEIIARLIHDLSPRHEREFMELNCASIPSELLESELFGHEAGAFTDARESKKGLFEIANGGSIFLDEIGEMSLNLQVKLLRFLELRSFRRVGGTKDIEVNVRIISATNQDLKERVEEKRFRSDLYYRLNVIPISLLPLRERKEDILPLFRFFLMDFMKRYNRDPRDLDEVSSRILLEYAWPGNVRELRNVVERLILMEGDQALDAETLRSSLGQDLARGDESMDQRWARILGNPLPEDGVPLEDLLLQLETVMILKALDETNGNQSRAARLLKLDRDKLRYRMKTQNIQKVKS